MFALSTATGNLQISSNTPPLNSDEERALEEEIANANIIDAGAPTHLDNDYYTLNFESFPQTVEDDEVKEVIQRVGKRPVQGSSGKGKKVLKKGGKWNDRGSKGVHRYNEG